MSLFPNHDTILSYCLTCAGTGHRGGSLSGKKLCKTCKGTGHRTVLFKTKGTVVDDFSSVTIPACYYKAITAAQIIGEDNGIHKERTRLDGQPERGPSGTESGGTEGET